MKRTDSNPLAAGVDEVDWMRIAIHFVIGFVIGAMVGYLFTFAWQGFVVGGIVLGSAAAALGDRLWWPLFYLMGIASRQMKGSIDAMNRNEDFSLHRRETDNRHSNLS